MAQNSHSSSHSPVDVTVAPGMKCCIGSQRLLPARAVLGGVTALCPGFGPMHALLRPSRVFAGIRGLWRCAAVIGVCCVAGSSSADAASLREQLSNHAEVRAPPAAGDAASPTAPSEASNVQADPQVDPLVDVWDSIRAGDAHVDSAEYDEAIVAYRRALERLSGAPEWRVQHNAVRRLLAAAYVGAYRISRDPVQLRKARDLLVAYLSELDAESEDRRSAQRQVEEIDVELAELEAELEAKRRALELEEQRAIAQTRAQNSLEQNRLALLRARKLTIAGSIVSSVGLLAAAPALAGKLMERSYYRRAEQLEDATQRESSSGLDSNQLRVAAEPMLTMALISTIAGSATLVTGVVLLATGVGQTKHLLGSSTVAVLPTRRGVHAQWSIRF